MRSQATCLGDSARYTHIFCVTAIRIDECKDGDSLYDDRAWADFKGDNVALIHNAAEFIERLCRESVRQGFRCDWSLVEYVDPSSYSGEMGAFRKFSPFVWQQEFRIALYHPDKFEKNEAVSINLGNLSDIAHGPVHKSLCVNKVVGREGKI